jgi:Arc/MetJ-type ribon-helix-helix transcriptional regulator
MQIELTPEQEAFVQQGIQNGRFQDRVDAMHRAMDHFVERERNRYELILSLDGAESSLRAGEGKTYSDETLHELVEDVERRGLARLGKV